jgi:hypothetical protein
VPTSVVRHGPDFEGFGNNADQSPKRQRLAFRTTNSKSLARGDLWGRTTSISDRRRQPKFASIKYCPITYGENRPAAAARDLPGPARKPRVIFWTARSSDRSVAEAQREPRWRPRTRPRPACRTALPRDRRAAPRPRRGAPLALQERGPRSPSPARIWATVSRPPAISASAQCRTAE